MTGAQTVCPGPRRLVVGVLVFVAVVVALSGTAAGGVIVGDTTGGELASIDTPVAVQMDESLEAEDTLDHGDIEPGFADGDSHTDTVKLVAVGDSTVGQVNSAQDPGGADLRVASLEAPGEIAIEDILIVTYTVENVGNESGTESVDLVVGDEAVSTDEDIQVDPGANETGQLVLDSIDERFDEGDTISFSVELPTFNNSLSGSTSIEGNSSEGGDGGDDNGTTGGALELVSIDAPEIIDPNTDLTVGYTIQNVGDQPATESFVDLRVDGAPFDTDDDVTVQPGETVNGSLSVTSAAYQDDQTVEYTVELIDFEDSIEGETFAGTVNRSGSVEIQGELKTDSTSLSVVIESIEDLDETGWLVAENLDTGVQSGTIPVREGEFETVLLEEIGGVQFGDSIEIRMAADNDFVNLLDTTTTTVDAGGNEPIAAFVWNPAVPDVGQPVALDAGNARGEGGNIVEYRWDFGNNSEFDTVTQSAVTQHSFESGGTNMVRLVVENEVGLTDETVEQVTVRESLEPAQPELSSLTVAGQGPQATIEAGSADVSVSVLNAGEAAGQFRLTLEIGSSVLRTTTTDELGGGEADQLIFEDATSVLDPGTYDITVSTADATVTGGVTVEASPEPEPEPKPEFGVSSVEANSPVTVGENLTVTAEVANTGDGNGTATLELEVGELGTDAVSVSLDSGESANRTLTVPAGLDSDGEYNLTVSAGETERNASVTVTQSGDSSSTGPVMVLVLMLVLLVFGGGLFYYSAESGGQADRL